MDYTKLSKQVSYALRHAPQEFGLALDDEGFVEVGDLLAALNARGDFEREITVDDLEAMIEKSAKKRHQICGGEIRALYGHSTETLVAKEATCPPDVLYHGTTHSALEAILRDGLKPMGRQRVHLSVDIPTAAEVGRRRDAAPVILEVDAQTAFADGVAFYEGNAKVWLADAVAPKYIAVAESPAL